MKKIKDFIKITKNSINNLIRAEIPQVEKQNWLREVIVNSIEAQNCNKNSPELKIRIRSNPFFSKFNAQEENDYYFLEVIDCSGGMTEQECKDRLGISVDKEGSNNFGVGYKMLSFLLKGSILCSWKQGSFIMLWIGIDKSDSEEYTYRIINLTDELILKIENENLSDFLLQVYQEYQTFCLNDANEKNELKKVEINFLNNLKEKGGSAVILLEDFLYIKNDELYFINDD